jgi:hypothetical protein
MAAVARLGIGIVIGLLVACMLLLTFTFESTIGQTMIYFAVPAVATLVAYIGAFGANAMISATSCQMNLKKTLLYSLIPAGMAFAVAMLFMIIESFFSVFSFPFNTIRFTYKFQSSIWSTASIVGLAFVAFWIVLYGQMISGSIMEIC